MSIINDALKKVEKSINYDYSGVEPKKNAQPPKTKVNKYLIYAFIFVLGLFIENTFFLNFHPETAFKLRVSETQTKDSNLKLSSEETLDLKQELPEQLVPETTQVTALETTTPAVPTAEEKEEEPQKTALVLNGIFFSPDNGYYALINNKIVKEGDDIDGVLVKRIDLNNVELESEEGKLVKLSRER